MLGPYSWYYVWVSQILGIYNVRGTYFLLGVAVRAELRGLAQKTAAKPGTMTLALVCDDLHIQTTAARATAANLTRPDPRVDQLLDISL